MGRNKSLKIIYNHENELQQYWITGLPLKVIIHGWLDSTEHEDGVFCIKIGNFLFFFSTMFLI